MATSPIPSSSAFSVPEDCLSIQADHISRLGCEAGVLADLLECKANNSDDSELTEPVYFIAEQLRRFRSRLVAIEEKLNAGARASRLALSPQEFGGAL